MKYGVVVRCYKWPYFEMNLLVTFFYKVFCLEIIHAVALDFCDLSSQKYSRSYFQALPLSCTSPREAKGLYPASSTTPAASLRITSLVSTRESHDSQLDPTTGLRPDPLVRIRPAW